MSFDDHQCTVATDFFAVGKWAECSCGWSGEIVTHEHLALADFAAHVHVAEGLAEQEV